MFEKTFINSSSIYSIVNQDQDFVVRILHFLVPLNSNYQSIQNVIVNIDQFSQNRMAMTIDFLYICKLF